MKSFVVIVIITSIIITNYQSIHFQSKYFHRPPLLLREATIFKLVSPPEIKKLFEENYIYTFLLLSWSWSWCISCYYTISVLKGLQVESIICHHHDSSPAFLLSYLCWLFRLNIASQVFSSLFLVLLINLERALLDK